MVQIEVSGPEHSKKGYIMVAIAKVLRDLGAEVAVLGEDTHLASKVSLTEDAVAEKLTGLQVRLTELQTGI